MSAELIPLAEAIAALRAQLIVAQQQGENEDLRFEVGPVEVEFQAVASREGEIGGKVGFRIFGLGSEASATGKLGDVQTQTIKLTLTPKTKHGRVVDVAGTWPDEAGHRDPTARDGG